MSMRSDGNSKMRVCIIDFRKAIQNDNRLRAFINALHDTVVLGRLLTFHPKYKWNHFGLTVVREDFCRILLPLKDWKSLSLFAFNKAINNLNQIVDNDVDSGMLLVDGHQKQKSKNDITAALMNVVKQFKDLKGKKEELAVSIFTLDLEKINVMEEINKFIQSNPSNGLITCIEVLSVDIYGRINEVVREKEAERVWVHTMPIRGLAVALENVCKNWIRPAHNTLTFTFSTDKSLKITAHYESLLVDATSLCINGSKSREMVPKKLFITSHITKSAIAQSKFYSDCYFLTYGGSTEVDDRHKWDGLWQIVSEDKWILVASEPSEDSVLVPAYALFPGSENRIILQPIASTQAALMNPSLITELSEMESTQAYDEFNSFTTKLPGTDELTLAKKNCIKLLKEHWSNEYDYVVGPSYNEPSRSKTLADKPGPTSRSRQPQGKQTVANKYAHPALGLY